MSNRLFHGMVLQMKDAIGRVIGVVDSTGVVIACSDLKRMGEILEDVVDELNSSVDYVLYNGYTYKSLSAKGMRFEYAIFIEGTDEITRTYCSLAVVSLNSLRQYYDEKHDKSTFIKNIILDNILPGDIYIKAKELHFGAEVPRVAFLIHIEDKTESTVAEVVQNIFPDKQKDFVININENDIAVIKEIKYTSDAKELKRIAKTIEDTLNSELLVRTTIGIGTVVVNLKDLARSYKEAQIAIEIGKVFESETAIIHYDNLGIGRLIYQLPTTLCKMFLSEVFKKGSVDMLDQETLLTIQKFFENNLNVSETSRNLYVHRNTLVYRLEKIKKITGLDLREFDHAIIFKVALMVKKYLMSQEKGE